MISCFFIFSGADVISDLQRFGLSTCQPVSVAIRWGRGDIPQRRAFFTSTAYSNSADEISLFSACSFAMSKSVVLLPARDNVLSNTAISFMPFANLFVTAETSY